MMNARTAADALLRDIRYALRVLRKAPFFTTAAVLTLAVAIGVNAAVFSLVDAVLLAPLPYPRPDRLALVSRVVTADGVRYPGTAVDGQTWEAVRDGTQSVRSAVFSTWISGANLTVPGTPGQHARHVRQQRVGTGFFDVLGVRPVIGREFTPDEDRPGGPPAVMLSAALWQGAFNADPAILGRSVLLKGTAVTVVGVLPEGFHTGYDADVWSPLRPSTTGEGGGENYHVLLRLRDDASWSVADAELARIGGDLNTRRVPGADNVRVSLSYEPLHDGITAGVRQPLMILWAAVGVVLLVACVNLAGLLLARSSQRSRELATRMALGSGRGGIFRQLIVESVVLSLAGGIAGVILGVFALDGLTWLARDVYQIWQPVALNGRSLAAAALLSLFASLVLGTPPALLATRTDVRAGLVSAGGRSIAAATSRWPRRIVIVSQVALGVVLLVAAGLLLRTFTHLHGLDPGFDADDIVAASVSLEDDRYRTSEQVTRLFDATLAQLHQTSGIESAAVMLATPYARLLNLGFVHRDGAEAASGDSRMTSATYVTADFFSTMGIPLRTGRPFTDADRDGAPPVAIVSDAFVRMYFGGASPVGRRIGIAGAEREIVGHAGDVQVRPGWGDSGPIAAMPLVYLPAAQITPAFMRLVHGWFSPTFVVRTAAGTAAAERAIRRAIEEVHPLLPLASVRPMHEVKAASLAQQRLLMALLAGLAAIAVGLTAVGIHGLIATAVAERTRELGIRMALGSTAGGAMRTAALPGILLAAAGVAGGLLASLAIVGTLGSFIWGISATDPLTFAGVAALVLTVAAVASVLPALRILRLDPAQALRLE